METVFFSYESHVNTLSFPFYKITIYMVVLVYYVLVHMSMCTHLARTNPELVTNACLITQSYGEGYYLQQVCTWSIFFSRCPLAFLGSACASTVNFLSAVTLKNYTNKQEEEEK